MDLSIRFWVSYSDFIIAGFLSSVVNCTLVHKCRPYRNLLTHRLCTIFMTLLFGICLDTLLITNSLWFRLVFRLLKCSFHSWDSSMFYVDSKKFSVADTVDNWVTNIYFPQIYRGIRKQDTWLPNFFFNDDNMNLFSFSWWCSKVGWWADWRFN